mmetsp:Transcript_24976/g.57716  ORF Transcript_24976/g.57716 Transcript_24976/m.57716 type:complete len:299 (-) Transcript_24976:19-915(-)
MTFSSALFSVSLSFLRSFTTFWSRFSAWARSARASSRLMTSASRTGSTEPSTWITFSSSKHRTTWTMASHCRMFPRNLLPRPSPEAAPFTRPAMSTNSRVEGMTWGRRILSARSSAVGFFERSRGDNFLRTYLHAFVDFFQDLEPRIGNFDDSDVRFDGAKRIIGGLRSLGLRQRVEKRRLSDVRETDDGSFQTHVQDGAAAEGPPRLLQNGGPRRGEGRASELPSAVDDKGGDGIPGGQHRSEERTGETVHGMAGETSDGGGFANVKYEILGRMSGERVCVVGAGVFSFFRSKHQAA